MLSVLLSIFWGAKGGKLKVDFINLYCSWCTPDDLKWQNTLIIKYLQCDCKVWVPVFDCLFWNNSLVHLEPPQYICTNVYSQWLNINLYTLCVCTMCMHNVLHINIYAQCICTMCMHNGMHFWVICHYLCDWLYQQIWGFITKYASLLLSYWFPTFESQLYVYKILIL